MSRRQAGPKTPCGSDGDKSPGSRFGLSRWMCFVLQWLEKLRNPLCYLVFCTSQSIQATSGRILGVHVYKHHFKSAMFFLAPDTFPKVSVVWVAHIDTLSSLTFASGACVWSQWPVMGPWVTGCSFEEHGPGSDCIPKMDWPKIQKNYHVTSCNQAIVWSQLFRNRKAVLVAAFLVRSSWCSEEQKSGDPARIHWRWFWRLRSPTCPRAGRAAFRLSHFKRFAYGCGMKFPQLRRRSWGRHG